MKIKAWILPLMMGSALGAVYVLPKAGKTEESAVRMTLPKASGGWELEPQSPSKQELDTLSRDTKFAKAICNKPRQGEVNSYGNHAQDRIDLSIVLSGNDLNNSIHRPERCMPAQGHLIIASQDIRLDLKNGRDFKVKRLRSIQSIKDPTTGEVLDKLNCLTYYFFVGHDKITNDHLDRTLTDMKDRLTLGVDQHWAYVSASIWFGNLPTTAKEVTEAEADQKLSSFLSGLSEKQINWDQITP